MKLDERFFNYYDDAKRLPNQIVLLNELINRNFEINDKRILTTPNFGVPVTSIILLMRDVHDELIKIQKNLHTEVKPLSAISTQELLNEYKLSLSTSASIDDTVKWERQQGHDIYPDQVISGSAIWCLCDNMYPNTSLKAPVNKLLTSNNPNVFIQRDSIKIKLEDSSSTKLEPLIVLYKNLIAFFEFSYSLQERIKNAEIKSFAKHCGKRVDLPTQKPTFNANNHRRGDLIHENFMNISISFDNSIKLGVARKKLIDLVKDGFDEACEWANETYKRMFDALN